MNYRVPGVYLEHDNKRIRPIKFENECLTAFIGIAEKGPLNKPVKIKSFKEYLAVFGSFTEYSYLAYSVYGYFISGGSECVIVRIAHQDKKDEMNSCRKAVLNIKDINKKDFLSIEALSEGLWGNYIQVKITYETDVSYVPDKLISKGNDFIEIETYDDLKPNDIIRIKNDNNIEYKKVIKIENKKVFINSNFKNDFKIEDESTVVDILKINFEIFSRDINEEYKFISLNENDDDYYLNVINLSSKLIRITKIYNGFLPIETFFENLNKGKNGILAITPGDFIGHFNGLNDNSGLGVLNSVNDVSLIAAPDILIFEELIHTDREKAKKDIYFIQKAIIDHCEKWGDRFAILDAPDIEDLRKLLKWRDKFDTQVAALYYPKIEIMNPLDDTGLSSLYVPPSGHIAGVYAECDEKEGIHRPPANKPIQDAVGLKYFVNENEYEIIYPKGINSFKYVPGRGIKIWGVRTLSSDFSWRYINVRRTFTLIRKAVKEGSGWAVFEPNNENLRKRIVRHITAFLIELWRKGYLSGNVPDDAFFIRCDDELNPPEDVDLGKITVEIGVAIAKPAEFLVIKINARA